VNLAFIDIETTGLSKERHELIDFAVVFDDNHSWSSQILPEHIETADAEALRVNGYRPDLWATALPMSIVAPIIAELLDGYTLVGHNARRFDVPFLRHHLEPYGLRSSVGEEVIDTLALSRKLLRGQTRRFNLKIVCEVLGIDPEDEIHYALEGAKRTYWVYRALSRLPGFDKGLK